MLGHRAPEPASSNDARRRTRSMHGAIVEKPQRPSAQYFARHLALTQKLVGHQGCVNTLAWSVNGEWLLSGSDDRHLNIWHGDTGSLALSLDSGHTANIFSAKFMPESNHQKIVSCAADGVVRYTAISRAPCYPIVDPAQQSYSSSTLPAVRPSAPPFTTSAFRCHADLAFKVHTDPMSPNTFFSCGDDAKVNMYDLRVAESCLCDACDRFRIIDMKSIARTEKSQREKLWRHKDNSKFGNHSIVRRGQGATSNRKNNNTTTTSTTDNLLHQTTSSNENRIAGSRERRHGRRLPLWLRGAFRNLSATFGVMAISVKPDQPATAANDDTVRIFDRRNITKPISAFIPSHLAAYERAYKTCATMTQTKKDKSERDTQSHTQHQPSSDSEWDPLLPTYDESQQEDCIIPSSKDQPLRQQEQARSPQRPDHRRLIDYKITDLRYDPSPNTTMTGVGNGDLLISYSRERIYLVDTSSSRLNTTDLDIDITGARWPWPRGSEDVAKVYRGHRNEQTMIKEANFYGNNSEMIVSGSDDGRVFIWDRKTCEIVNVFAGDKRVVNAVQAHPYLPYIAVSGIDDEIRYFTPTSDLPVDLTGIGLQSIIQHNEHDMEYASTILDNGVCYNSGSNISSTIVKQWINSMYTTRTRNERRANHHDSLEDENDDSTEEQESNYDEEYESRDSENNSDSEDDDASITRSVPSSMVLQLLVLLTGDSSSVILSDSLDGDDNRNQSLGSTNTSHTTATESTRSDNHQAPTTMSTLLDSSDEESSEHDN